MRIGSCCYNEPDRIESISRNQNSVDFLSYMYLSNFLKIFSIRKNYVVSVLHMFSNGEQVNLLKIQ